MNIFKFNLIIYRTSSPSNSVQRKPGTEIRQHKNRNTRKSRAKTNTTNKRTLCPARQPNHMSVCVFIPPRRCVCFCASVCLCTLQHWLSMADAVDWRLPATKYRWWWRETRNRTKTRMRTARGRKRSSFVFQTRVAMRAQHGMLTNPPTYPTRWWWKWVFPVSGCACV